ncbi:MAG TPA: TonB family protein [Candidatus Sulfotelmatobacter sp.]|jgi:protein TonB|nr:TonB family protein [Candidatus Sulfotelmatobacter sp.]
MDGISTALHLPAGRGKPGRVGAGWWFLPLSLLLHLGVIAAALVSVVPPPPVTPPAPVIELELAVLPPPPAAAVPPAPPKDEAPPLVTTSGPAESRVAKATVHAPPKAKPQRPPQPQDKPAPLADAPETAAVSPSPPSAAAEASPPATHAAALPQEQLSAYVAVIRTKMEKAKRYPSQARYDGQEGTVALRFSLDSRGQLLSASVQGSSGIASLDEEAVHMAQRAAPFPAFPSSLETERLDLVVPVKFSLKSP